MSEERRKMAWDLVLAVARSGVNPDTEWSAKTAWEVVDSFLENEGGGEPPDHDRMRLVAVSRMNSLLQNEVEQLTNERDKAHEERDEALDKIESWKNNYDLVAGKRDALEAENEKLKEFKKGALDDIDRLTARIAVQKEDYSELKAKIEELKKTEIGSVMQEKLSLEFRCQGLEADLNRAKDELTAEVEKLKAENSRLHEELSHAWTMEKR
jgi:chromosome segregation ATPase